MSAHHGVQSWQTKSFSILRCPHSTCEPGDPTASYRVGRIRVQDFRQIADPCRGIYSQNIPYI